MCQAWRRTLTHSVDQLFSRMDQKGQGGSYSTVKVLPFMKLVPKETYVDIILNFLKRTLSESDTYSPSLPQIRRELGETVYNKVRDSLQFAFFVL